LQIVEFPKFNEKTSEHIHVKKLVYLNNKTTIDFMLRLCNNESEVINDSFLAVLELKVSSPININDEITQIEYETVEKLLKEKNIEGYNLLYPSDNKPDLFSLLCVSLLYCPLCN